MLMTQSSSYLLQLKTRSMPLVRLVKTVTELQSCVALVGCSLTLKKMKVMLFGTDSCLEDWDTSPSCNDLGEILDSHLSFNNHMNYLSSALLGKLCQIKSPTSLYEGCPFSHPALWYFVSCSIAHPCGRGQHNRTFLQNFAARIVIGKRKYDLISPSLKELTWRNINEC